MKNIVTIFILFVSTLGSTQSSKLIVNVTNFKNNHGKVMIGIYKGKENFMKIASVRKLGNIIEGKAQVVFENLPNGEYAISLYHDENDNNTLDTGWFGIPKEGYGCSNNAKGKMGPPKYEDAKFQLTKDNELTIKLNN
jgi:uncharacterized protein (DUF2141 family)